MNIQVKGINDYLSFILNDKMDFKLLLTELGSLLDKPMFYKDGHYSKAFFDFKGRKLSEMEFDYFFNLIMEKQSVLFCGMNVEFNENKTVEVVDGIIHNGQIIEKEGDVLFIGKINPGGYLKSSGNIYLLGQVEGSVIVTHPKSIISAQSLKNAMLQIYNVRKHDVTVSALSMFYYVDGKIISKNGVDYDGKKHCSYIR